MVSSAKKNDPLNQKSAILLLSIKKNYEIFTFIWIQAGSRKQLLIWKETGRVASHYHVLIVIIIQVYLFRANRASNAALGIAVHAQCRFLHDTIFAAAIGCVGAISSTSAVHNLLYCRQVLQISFVAISKNASTSVRESEQGMLDRGECKQMPKSCLFSIHHASERASVPLVIRWLPERVYIHISMIANVFFFEVPTPYG